MPRRLISVLALLILTVGFANAATTAAPTVTVGSKYPRLSSGPLQNAVLATLPAGALLSSDGVTITAKDISAKLKSISTNSDGKVTLASVQNYSFFIMEQIAVDKILAKDATDWAKANKADSSNPTSVLIKRYLDSIVSGIQVTEEEARQFYDANREMIGDATFDKSKVEITMYLQREKKQAEINKLITSMSTRHKIKISGTWTAEQFKKWQQTPVEKVRASGKPSMVVIGAGWCEPCKQLEPIRVKLSKKYKGKMNSLHIDAETDPMLASYYDASSIPLIIFFDKNGNQTFQQAGFMDEASLEKEIAKLGVK